jgi:uncharacterized membrane protein YfcA
MELPIYYMAVIFLFVGFFSGLLGIGGGIILMPTLLAFGIDMKVAVGISIIQMISASSFGTFLNYKNSTLNIKNSLIMGFGGFIGAIIGAYILNIVESSILQFLFLTIVVVAITQSLGFIKPIWSIGDEPLELNRKLIFLIGLISGSISIPIGVGGAIIIIAFFSLLGLEAKKVSSMSLFFVLFTSVSAFISIYFNNNELILDYNIILYLAIFTIIGSYLGITIKNKLHNNHYKKLFLPLYFASLITTLYSIY